MKLLSRPDRFMLYGKLGVDFFSTSELLYPNMKSRLRLIRARPNFYMISDNPNVSLGIVNSSLYTRRIALRNVSHKKRMDMFAYAPVEYLYLETLAKVFIIPARQNQFIEENIFNNAPIRRVAIAMNTNSAFTGSFTENPSWCQQCDLRQIRILRGRQPIVYFDTVDNCRLYVTTMKAMNYQGDIPSIPIDEFKDHYALYRVNECRRLQLTSLVLLEEISKRYNVSLQPLFNRIRQPTFSHSNFGNSVRSPQTMLQLLIMTLLLLSTRNPALCRVNIGS